MQATQGFTLNSNAKPFEPAAGGGGVPMTPPAGPPPPMMHQQQHPQGMNNMPYPPPGPDAGYGGGGGYGQHHGGRGRGGQQNAHYGNPHPRSQYSPNPPMHPNQVAYNQNRGGRPPMQNQPPPPHLQRPQYGGPMPHNAPPTYMQQPLPPPVKHVVLVTGYRKTGKTAVARELAKVTKFTYISLRYNNGEENMDDNSLHPQRFKPLIALLETRNNYSGIVIDDALMNNKYEPYYVEHLLSAFGMHLSVICIISCDLSDLGNRGVNYEETREMTAHPESFEFGGTVEDVPGNETRVALVDGTDPLDTVVTNAVTEVKRILQSTGQGQLLLPPVEFLPGCPLLCNPDHVEVIINDEFASLDLTNRNTFGIPYTEPNFLMEYSLFVRKALLFKEYHVIPWIEGDKVSLVYHKDKLYIHLTTYKLIFEVAKIHQGTYSVIESVAKELMQEKTAAGVDLQDPVLFSLEATMLNGQLYISDMMRLGMHTGMQKTLIQRIKLLQKHFSALPADGCIHLLKFYDVREVKKCIEDYPDAHGALFVNPDGMHCGTYESNNILYFTQENKTVQLRLWNGRVEDSDWVFDGLFYDGYNEVAATGKDNEPIPVVISDEQVMENNLNDGNIVECFLEQGQNKKKKGQQKFRFVRRCQWKVSPYPDYYRGMFTSDATWPASNFFEACALIEPQAESN